MFLTQKNRFVQLDQDCYIISRGTSYSLATFILSVPLEIGLKERALYLTLLNISKSSCLLCLNAQIQQNSINNVEGSADNAKRLYFNVENIGQYARKKYTP